MDMEIDGIPVLLANVEDTEEIDKLKTHLQSLPGVNLLPYCSPFEYQEEYIWSNLYKCKYAVYLAHEEKYIRSLLPIFDAVHRWEIQANARKFIPIYSTRAAYNHQSTIQSVPAFLKEQPLFMDDANFQQNLLDQLTANTITPSILDPLGEIAKGLAINYADAARLFLSDEFEKRYIAKCDELSKELVATDPTAKVVRVPWTVIAIPETCSWSFSLDAYASALKLTEDERKKQTVMLPKGAVDGMERPFTMTVYILKGKDSNSQPVIYLPIIEVPNIPSTLNKVYEGNTKHYANNIIPLNDRELEIQREEFIRTMKQLLDRKFKGKYICLPFKEQEKNLDEKVIEAIHERERNPTPCEPKLTACIWPDDSESVEEIDRFEEQLKEHGVDVQQKQQFISTFQDPKDRLIILWIKKGHLSDEQKVHVNELISSQDRSQRLQFIAVLVDGAEMKLDSELGQAVENFLCVYLKHPETSVSYKKAVEKIAGAFKGELQFPVNTGPCHIGLACATFFNYLFSTNFRGQLMLDAKLGDLRSVVEKYQNANPDEKFVYFPKLIVLTEKLGRTTGEVDICYEGQTRKAPKPFEDFGFEILDTPTASWNVGSTKRFYATFVFKFDYNGTTYIAGIEYVRAVACLGNTERSLQVKLSNRQLAKSYQGFNEMFTKLKATHPSGGNCLLVSYDEDEWKDEGELNLRRLIGSHIEREMQG